MYVLSKEKNRRLFHSQPTNTAHYRKVQRDTNQLIIRVLLCATQQVHKYQWRHWMLRKQWTRRKNQIINNFN